MTYTPLKCSNCGSNRLSRQAGELTCSFCGAAFAFRLEPGTICADEGSISICTLPAESLCRSCCRPLCDRHNDPKLHYWQHPLDCQVLCANWTTEDAADWARLEAQPTNLPLPDFTPFEWKNHSRESLYAIGRIEEEIAVAIRPIVEKGAGELRETVCRFDSVCSDCLRVLIDEINATVAAFQDRYRQLAFEQRLDALRDESEQSVRYIEEFLGCPVDCTVARVDEDSSGRPLSTESDTVDWHRCGLEYLNRLQIISRLRFDLAHNVLLTARGDQSVEGTPSSTHQPDE